MARTSSRPIPEFGQLLKQFRTERGWTQEDLVSEAIRTAIARHEFIGEGVTFSRTTISYIESGATQRPHDATVRALAQTLFPDKEQPEDRAKYERLIKAKRWVEPAIAAPTLPTSEGNLSHRRDQFIGREQDLAALIAALHDSPLVTIVGPGGCGKTRLALELARVVAGNFPDGVWVVSLASLEREDDVAEAAVRVLPIPAQPGGKAAEAIRTWARGKCFLLILDSCEHVLPSCTALTEQLLAIETKSRTLATTREPLQLTGEWSYRIRPLALPVHLRPTNAAEIADTGSVKLFVARARLSQHDFELTDENAMAVAAICRRLDGLPLAIELAAAQLDTFSTKDLARRITRRFQALQRAEPAIELRQRTLRSTLDWSNNLLSPIERILLRRVAIFAGGWTITALELICGDGELRGEEPANVLTRLVHKSLVVADTELGEVRRYRLLETIREYALEQLAAAEEVDTLEARRGTWCLALAESLPAPLDGGPAARTWLAELAAESDNLRAALDWAREHSPEFGLRLSGAIWPFWFARFDHVAARAVLRDFLGRVPNSPWRARALQGLGFLAAFADIAEAYRCLAEALRLAVAAADSPRLHGIRWQFAYVCILAGRPSEAEPHLRAGWALIADDPRPARHGPYRMVEGFLALAQGDLTTAREALVAAHADAIAADQPFFRCIILARLGALSLRRGALREAIAEHEDLQHVATHLGAWFYRFAAHLGLAQAHEWADEFTSAEEEYRTALSLSEESGGNPLERAMVLLGLGRLALHRDGGKQTAAIVFLEECAALVTEINHGPLRREIAFPLGLAYWRRGRVTVATARLDEALMLYEGGDAAGLAHCLAGTAGLAAERGAPTLAARWLGAAVGLRQGSKLWDRPLESRLDAMVSAMISRQIGDKETAIAMEAGRTLTRAEAVTEARAWIVEQ